jgi:DNA-binding SARP family transcriptional activator
VGTGTTTVYRASSGRHYAFAAASSGGAALSQGFARSFVDSHLAPTQSSLGPATRETSIELCGQLTIRLEGRQVDRQLPGRQVRLIFAYLVVNRSRPVSRDELIDVVWPDVAPADPGAALSTLLARLRAAIGEGVLQGRHGLTLCLPSGAWVDLEAAELHVARAQAALDRRDHAAALEASADGLRLIERPLLPEFDETWVEERRRELDDLRLSTYETMARAGLALGPNGLGRAERAARELIKLAAFRESGYALLMQVYARRGDAAEGLRVFDRLRVLLREELGVMPSRTLTALNEALLRSDAPDA